MKRKMFISVGFIVLSASPVIADPYAQPIPVAPTNVYSVNPVEPTCCYSEQRIWKKTNTQSGWSVSPEHYQPMGFAQRDHYRPSRPTPLPRDRQEDNPWSVIPHGYAGQNYVRKNQNRSRGSNAEYFQPAGYHYPPPVRGHNELDYVPEAFTGYGDPFLTGMAYPGYAPIGYGAPWGGGPYSHAPGFFPPVYGPYGW